MKTVHLLRHAKSSWKDPALADFDRPLAKRGQKACRALARFLPRLTPPPDLVLCSPARRARETLEAIAAALEPAPVLLEGGLYMAEGSALLARLRRLPDGLGSVLLIGHNPGLEQLALALADETPTPARERLRAKFPTAALATLNLPAVEWAELAEGSGRIEAFRTPSDLD